jgi:asparagine synthase (glutamine-hydrolysing)
VSGILAVVGQVRESRLESALPPLRYLGGEREQLWSEDDALLLVTRKAWQLEDDFSGDILVLETPDLVVAADASLFDKKGLARQLSTAGVRARGETASHYLEAAYRAWGSALVEHLNGDYAFVIWDRQQRQLVAARDPLGGRPLFFTRIGSGIAVASSCRALAELRGSADQLNLANLGGQVAGLAWSNGLDTAYQGVDTLRPGSRVAWSEGGVTLETWWHPREAPDRRPAPAAEAAEELRDLLGTAVSQRLSNDVTTVWMSGGWDSTAVFAAGQRGLEPGSRSRLRPVSISYPEGDPGREDEYIRLVADHWGSSVHWLRSDDLRLLDGLAERAGRFDEPPAHLYELWNRGLARGTREVGARVTLDGCGGDQLFQVSDVLFADLLRAGRWLKLAGLARSRTARGWRYLARVGALPLVPDVVVRAGEQVAGRRYPRHYLERSLTKWMRPEFLADHRVRERDLDLLRSVRGGSIAHDESRLYLTLPVWGWGASFMRGALLQEGVEVRSPLLDPNVVDFALGRPIAERGDGTETKRLLRQAMEGLLPAEVLAPRTHRTGVTVGFSRRHMREAYPGLLAELLSRPLRLADLGIVDADVLRDSAARFLAGDGDEFLRVNLFHAMKVEFWLRGRDREEPFEQSAVGAMPTAIEIPAA